MLSPPFDELLKAKLLDLAPVIIAVHDVNYNIVWANKTYQKATGLTLKEIEGKKCYSAWKLSKPCFGCPVLASIQTGKPQEAELTPQNQDHWPATQGSWLSKAAPIRDESGSIVGAIETAYEITELKQIETDLKKSEKEKSAILDAMSELVAYQDKNHNVLWANKAAAVSVNEKPENLIGKKCYELWAGRESECDICPVAEAFSTGHVHSNKIETQDEKVWNITGYPVKDEAGEVIGVVEVTDDITKTEHAEKALRESEERFRVIFERSTVGKSLTRPDGSLLQVNKTFADMLGYTIEEIQRLNFEQITYPDDVAESREHIRSLLAGEETTCRFEKRYLHKSGSIVWADVSTTLLLDEQGIPLYLITNIVNITEHKRADAALRESELLFRKVFEDHAAVKLIIDPVTEAIIDANKAAVAFYGWSHEQLTQMKVQEINTLSPEEVKKEMEKARDNKQIHFEFRHRRADGSVRDVGVFSSKIEVNKKDLLHSIIFDITARKQAEEKLQDTLDRLQNAVSTTIQVMVSTVEARDPYTAGHQVRTADLARAIATEMGLSEDTIEGIRVAGSIHDIGKLSVPAEILSKPSKLTEMECALIREHPEKGYNILKNVESPWPLAEIVYQHHERMDGSGYPRNLKGDEIVMEARIMAVADVVEAMSSHRPYRPALGIETALKEIEDNRGVLYDADVVDTCMRLFREIGYQFTGN